MAKKSNPQLSNNDSTTLLKILQKRFETNLQRHKGIEWASVEAKLRQVPESLWSLQQMEDTGGEPDVVRYDKIRDQYTFFDCAAESPKGRRSWCYDHEALESRKQHKPKNSAVNAAEEIGIQLLNETDYKFLQTLGEFDLKTSSWIATPERIRKLGGALFGDRRFDTVFIYHNGAESYYGARGFRGTLII